MNKIFFLFVFLPLLVAIYYILPRQFRNYILLLFSLIFYAWGGVSYTIILIASVVINYFFVKQLEQNTRQKKKWLITGLIFNTLVIGLEYSLNKTTGAITGNDFNISSETVSFSSGTIINSNIQPSLFIEIETHKLKREQTQEFSFE